MRGILFLTTFLAWGCFADPNKEVATPAPDFTGDGAGTGARAAGESERRPLEPGHRKMLELLEEIAQATNEKHPYLGSAQLVGLRKELALMGEDGPARDRWKLHFIVGQQELRLGNERAAIESLSRAYELLSEAQPGARWAHETTFHLGVAYMRLGETQNCCQRNSPDSCILPLRGDGVHTRRDGSSQAIRYFREILESRRYRPGRARNSKIPGRAQWLLNIAHMTLGSYPAGVPEEFLIPARAFEPEMKFQRFRNRSAELGIDTFSLSGGVIVDDFDGDGYLDIVTSSWNTTGQLRFFRNNADGTFSNRTELAGLIGLSEAYLHEHEVPESGCSSLPDGNDR